MTYQVVTYILLSMLAVCVGALSLEVRRLRRTAERRDRAMVHAIKTLEYITETHFECIKELSKSDSEIRDYIHKQHRARMH